MVSATGEPVGEQLRDGGVGQVEDLLEPAPAEWDRALFGVTVEARRLTFGNIDLGSWREVTRRGRVLTKGVRLLAVAR
jgi:hypothetical protein